MDRNLLAISIKHTKHGWKFGMPCLLWGRRTADNEKRSFGGYTDNPNEAEIYTLKEWQDSGYGTNGVCKVDEPVKMEVGFCHKWREYDTVLVTYHDYMFYCKACGFEYSRCNDILVSIPFDYKEDFADDALECLHNATLPYAAKSTIGLALGKLKLLEMQGMYPREKTNE